MDFIFPHATNPALPLAGTFLTSQQDFIRLRSLMMKDAQGYYALYSDPLAIQYLPDEDCVFSLKEAQEHIQYFMDNREAFFWALADEVDNFIGMIGLNNFCGTRAFAVYGLMPFYWQRGIMKQALKSVVNFGFTTLGFEKICAKTMLENAASQNTLKSVGFYQESRSPYHRKIRGKNVDIFTYALSKKMMDDL